VTLEVVIDYSEMFLKMLGLQLTANVENH